MEPTKIKFTKNSLLQYSEVHKTEKSKGQKVKPFKNSHSFNSGRKAMIMYVPKLKR